MEKYKSYAGIGSRDTPAEILTLMKSMAVHLAKHNYVLRSGGVKGADKAFEDGCDLMNGPKEIYLPWNNFEGSISKLIVKPNSEAFLVAEQYHPYWHNLSDGAKKLQARNSHQVLGQNLKIPCNFLICYTKGGKGGGGTGQAIRIAKKYNIPIFDCGKYDNIEETKKAYRDFLFKINTSSI